MLQRLIPRQVSMWPGHGGGAGGWDLKGPRGLRVRSLVFPREEPEAPGRHSGFAMRWSSPQIPPSPPTSSAAPGRWEDRGGKKEPEEKRAPSRPRTQFKWGPETPSGERERLGHGAPEAPRGCEWGRAGRARCSRPVERPGDVYRSGAA